MGNVVDCSSHDTLAIPPVSQQTETRNWGHGDWCSNPTEERPGPPKPQMGVLTTGCNQTPDFHIYRISHRRQCNSVKTKDYYSRDGYGLVLCLGLGGFVYPTKVTAKKLPFSLLGEMQNTGRRVALDTTSIHQQPPR